MKKVITMSSVLLGVVFLAGCGQQPVSQTQPKAPTPVAQQVDETASWQTYTNTKYGFEMKYPKDWQLMLNVNTTDQLPGFNHGSGISPDQTEAVASDAIFLDSIFDKEGAPLSSKGSIEANVAELKGYKNHDFGNIIPIGNGKAFYFVNQEPDPSGRVEKIPMALIVGNSSAFNVDYRIEEKTTSFEQAEKMLKKVISTVKFTK